MAPPPPRPAQPANQRQLPAPPQRPPTKPGTLVKFLACCVLMVASMHAYHAWLGYDPLARIGINGNLVSVDSWSLVHVVYFAGLGYLHPDQLGLFMVYGAVWELIEWALAQSPVVRSFWEERLLNTFWDLWFNLLGYRLGEMALLVLEDRRQRQWLKAHGKAAGQGSPEAATGHSTNGEAAGPRQRRADLAAL